MTSPNAPPATEVEHDRCSLTLVQRLLAMLDRDPASLRVGDCLPHGWHNLMFNPPTRQSALRPDGATRNRVNIPGLEDLPRLMFAGRRCRFPGEIAIGADVRQETRRLGEPVMKQGRSGRFALVAFEHRIFVEGEAAPAAIELRDYVLREAALPPSAAAPVVAVAAASEPASARPGYVRSLLPDEVLNFRYSAICDNPHRIHTDLAYATQVEGYPALVVNGGIPATYLHEVFRSVAGREPVAFDVRNVAAMFCGAPLHFFAQPQGDAWKLWVQDDAGRTTVEASGR